MAKTFDLFLRDFGIGHLRLQSSLWGLDEQRAHLKLSVARTYLISTVCCLKIQTEVFAENRRRELRRSPLRPYADLIHAWGLRLFVVRSPGGLCGAPSSAGEISVQIFSKKYCFSKFSFSGQSFHQKQTLGSIPGDAPAEFQAIRSFIHACLVSSSSNFSDRLCHIHACITVNSPSDQVILWYSDSILYSRCEE